MKNQFGKNSTEKISGCHSDIQKILRLAISRSAIDFGVSEGHRPVEVQKEMYAKGRTKPGRIITYIDGVTKKGSHNHKPSRSVDIYAYHPDREVRRKIAYDLGSLCYIAGVISSCAEELYLAGEVQHVIRWGGNWDNDGVILQDQSFDDLPHFELKSV